MKYYLLVRERLLAFLGEKDGASAIEYAIIAGLMAVLIIGALASFGDGLSSVFEGIQAMLTDVSEAIDEAELPTPGSN